VAAAAAAAVAAVLYCSSCSVLNNNNKPMQPARVTLKYRLRYRHVLRYRTVRPCTIKHEPPHILNLNLW